MGANLITRKKGFMKFDEFKIIADKIKPFAKEVILAIWGEPLMNKDIFKIIEYTASFAEIVCLSTNGNLMTREYATKIITSGTTNIIISIDGTTQKVYEKYRVNGFLDKAMNALRMLAEIKKQLKSNIIIIPQFIVFKHNMHQMLEFDRICRDIGVKADFKAPYLRENSTFSESNIPEYVRGYYSNKSEWFTAMSNCSSAFNDMSILRDGTTVPCCCTSNNEVEFGNLLQLEFDEIWDSKQYRDFRWSLMHGNAPNYCKEKCLMCFLTKKDKFYD